MRDSYVKVLSSRYPDNRFQKFDPLLLKRLISKVPKNVRNKSESLPPRFLIGTRNRRRGSTLPALIDPPIIHFFALFSVFCNKLTL